MSSTTLVDEHTLRAYRETDYRVLGEAGFVLRIDQFNAALAAAHATHDCTCSAFITAFNPHSVRLPDAENLARQQALREVLRQQQSAFLDGIGQHPDSHWPGEPSFLVFGLSVEEACTMGQRFAQNAIVWAGSTAIPQLIFCLEAHCSASG